MVTGIVEQPEAELRLSPNPATDELWVELGGMDSGPLVVTDALGRLVWKRQVNGERNMRLDLSGWASGQYLLSVATTQEKRWWKFVIL